MPKSKETKTEEFTILRVDELDWGMDPEPPIYRSMSIVAVMIGAISAIALSAWLNVNYSATPQLYQSARSHTGEYGHRSFHQ